ncbi:hypothetical protein D918_05487 [Trichuris suis]|nr:hypothetical protein D918_05487 [Trichuris suis]
MIGRHGAAAWNFAAETEKWIKSRLEKDLYVEKGVLSRRFVARAPDKERKGAMFFRRGRSKDQRNNTLRGDQFSFSFRVHSPAVIVVSDKIDGLSAAQSIRRGLTVHFGHYWKRRRLACWLALIAITTVRTLARVSSFDVIEPVPKTGLCL